jgi:exonuclease V gamma subunit
VGKHHELRLWIRHLVQNAAGEPDAESLLIGRAAKGSGVTTVRFRPVEAPLERLAALIDLYRAAQSYPLPLFGYASRVYVETLRKPRAGPARALEAARKAFTGSAYHFGDDQDEYVALLYAQPPPELAGAAPPDDRPGFAASAITVFGPLLDHREEI